MRAFLAVLAVVLFFVLISCSSSESSPTAVSGGKDNASIQSTDVSHLTYDAGGVVRNSCVGELVDYTGTVKLTFKSKELGNGSTSSEIRSDIKAKGVGRSTGIDYEVMSTGGSVSEYEVGQPFPKVFTFSQERKLVSKGSADNAWIIFTSTLTYDASGQLTDVDVESSTECR